MSVIKPPSGVQDLRSELEWYNDGRGRSSDGIPLQIAGVWDVICGNPYRTNGTNKAETITDMRKRLLENREKFADNDETGIKDVDRVINLLKALDNTDHEHRYYREDRERESRYDVRAQCWVGLYHVTEKTTIVCHKHTSPGMGMTSYTVSGVATPRRDIEEYLDDEVFYGKYDYTRAD